jgi:hypothetical protein
MYMYLPYLMEFYKKWCLVANLLFGYIDENFPRIPGNPGFPSDFRGLPEWVFPIRGKKKSRPGVEPATSRIWQHRQH